MAIKPTPNWREQLFYFLMVDRFSDEDLTRPLRDPADPHHMPSKALTTEWYWNLWAISGRNRYQGGTIKGIIERLPYLVDLGVTALWLSPFYSNRVAGADANANGDGTDDPIATVDPKQLTRRLSPADLLELQLSRDDYHGYAIQDFEGVDPRFGTKADVKALVDAAHDLDIYVIFDIMLNHSGECFTYDVPSNPMRPPYVAPFHLGEDLVQNRYPFGSWLDADNHPLPVGVAPRNREEGLWPESLQSPDCFTREGSGSYGDPHDDPEDQEAQFRVADYRNRDFSYPAERPQSGVEGAPVLQAMIKIWCDWIDETGCDGFRIDTFKHVPKWVAEDATAAFRAHAATSGKNDFLVFGEVAGGERFETDLIDIEGVRLLELDGRRDALRALAQGKTGNAALALTPPDDVWIEEPPGQWRKRKLPADKLIMTIDDHDGLWDGPKRRLAALEPGRDQYVLPAAAYLLFGPSIPCLYYGTEQALSGPVDADGLLDSFGYGPASGKQGGDRYLREAMFGPDHPRHAGRAGRPGPGDAISDPRFFDDRLPGFGPGGSSGVQAFDPQSRWYQGIAALAAARRAHPVLATGTIQRLTRGRVGAGGGFRDNLDVTAVVWLRHAAGEWAVVVVDVRPPDRPAVTVDVALPALVDAAGKATRPVAIVAGEAKPDTSNPVAQIGVRTQTGEAYLSLEALRPGEIRVYAS